MSITITATATATASGSLTPLIAKGQNVVNGDFLILRDRTVPSRETGDGSDEETIWTFYFEEDPNISLFSPVQPLTSALLTLTLTPTDQGFAPEDQGITTDGVWIETLEVIGGAPIAPEIQTLPVGITATIKIELLDRLPSYTSTAILGILFGTRSVFGNRISMRYNDDAIISFAQLELTQDS